MGDSGDIVRAGSRVSIVWGIAVLVLGLLAIAMPFITGVAVTVMIGIILIAAGVAQFLYTFKSKSFGEGAFRFLFGILAALAGMSLVTQPDAGLATITLFLAVWFFVDGVITLVQGFRWRPFDGWGWMVFSGAVSIILGVMIWRQFPVSAIWLVGLLVGIRLMFVGWTMIMLGSVGEEIADTLEKTEKS